MSPRTDAWHKAVKAFWDEMPSAVRTAIIIGATGWSASYATKQMAAPTPHAIDVLMDEDDWRKVVREELSPMKAGFKAFIATQPDKVQVVVLRAMQRAEDKQKGND